MTDTEKQETIAMLLEIKKHWHLIKPVCEAVTKANTILETKQTGV